MFSQMQSQPKMQLSGPAATKVIESPDQYQSCHIRVPDLEKPVPAILVDQDYYSFFKAVKGGEKTLEIVAKLGKNGDSTAITKTANGYVVWVREPDAVPAD